MLTSQRTIRDDIVKLKTTTLFDIGVSMKRITNEINNVLLFKQSCINVDQTTVTGNFVGHEIVHKSVSFLF